MRRLITLLFAAAATTAVVRAIVRKRAAGSADEPGPSVMPRPTAAPVAPPPREEPMEDKTETPGPIEEGESGAITAAPVPEEPIVESERAADDSELERDVQTKIAEDPAVEAESVEVDVEAGVAQLRGTVPDEQTALRVGDDAARIDGVIGLDDQLDRQSEAAERSEGAEPGAAERSEPGAAEGAEPERESQRPAQPDDD